MKRRIQFSLVVAAYWVSSALAGPPSAAVPIRRREVVPSAVTTEASLDFLIGLAGKLQHDDHAKELAELEAQLGVLKEQKQALLSKIKAAVAQAALVEQTGYWRLVAEIQAQINGLRTQLEQVELEIKGVIQKIERLRDEEQRDLEDATRAAEGLRRFQVTLEGVAAKDSLVSRLAPEQKKLAGDRVRRALSDLAAVRRSQASLLDAAAVSLKVVPTATPASPSILTAPKRKMTN